MGNFESNVPENPNETIRHTILEQLGVIVEGAVKEIVESRGDVLLGNVTSEMIMAQLFPTNEVLQKDTKLREEVEKELISVKERGIKYERRRTGSSEAALDYKRLAKGARYVDRKLPKDS